MCDYEKYADCHNIHLRCDQCPLRTNRSDGGVVASTQAEPSLGGKPTEEPVAEDGPRLSGFERAAMHISKSDYIKAHMEAPQQSAKIEAASPSLATTVGVVSREAIFDVCFEAGSIKLTATDLETQTERITKAVWALIESGGKAETEGKAK